MTNEHVGTLNFWKQRAAMLDRQLKDMANKYKAQLKELKEFGILQKRFSNLEARHTALLKAIDAQEEENTQLNELLKIAEFENQTNLYWKQKALKQIDEIDDLRKQLEKVSLIADNNAKLADELSKSASSQPEKPETHIYTFQLNITEDFGLEFSTLYRNITD